MTTPTDRNLGLSAPRPDGLEDYWLKDGTKPDWARIARRQVDRGLGEKVQALPENRLRELDRGDLT